MRPHGEHVTALNDQLSHLPMLRETITPYEHAGWCTLTHLLSDRAKRHPDRPAATFIDDEGVESSLSYGQLHRRAQSVAAQLATCCSKGDRALLHFPPGLEFLVGFFGANYAGLVPAPTCFPKPGRAVPRLESAAGDCNPAALIADQTTLDGLDPSKLSDKVNALFQVATDNVADADFDLEAVELSRDDLGLLQYTSGSTSDPKGVMVSHGNLLANLESIRRGFSLDWPADDSSELSRGVFWLPAFHDMGLIGGILEPLYLGGHTILMSPRRFLQKPLAWLQAISDYKASISGAPNFAYQLCVDRIDTQDAEALDLSGWETAFCGAEPINAETLDRFVQRFRIGGFRPTSFYPCYGLAEATLLASGGDGAREPKFLNADRDALANGKFVVASEEAEGNTTRRLVCCGGAAHAMRIEIVDPNTQLKLEENRIGEIWLQGDSIARGYWNRPDVNAAQFQATLPESSNQNPFFRTGDLGFLHDGELYVTGRLKDMIILRGRNHFPQDIEATIRNSLNGDGGGQSAAIAVPGSQGDALAIVVEVSRHTEEDSMPDIVRKLRRSLIEEHEVDARHVVLTRPGVVPLTTSGKVQRQACRQAFLDNEIKLRHRWDRSGAGNGRVAYPELPAAIKYDDLTRVSETIEGWLLSWLIAESGLPESEVTRERPFAEYGLDSMAAVELTGEIEDWLGLELSPTLAWNYPTPAKLAPHLANQLAGITESDDDIVETDASVAEFESLLSEIENMSDDEIDDALTNPPL